MNGQSNMQALTVTDVNRYIKSLLTADDVLSSVSIRGEISNFKAHGSGHLYFTLKDEGAEISAVMFRGDASRMQFRPTDGMRVVAHGSVDVYEKSGRYQVYVRAMQADGVGAMMLAYERLKKKLLAEGLFDPARKKPIPRFPSCVGVITAPTGAAVRDILNITGRRYPQAKILLYPSLVQGADAPANLCAGLLALNAMAACDVIILGRGGGSLEDLWAFNDEALVRAVAASEIPVISAVGHETDFTLCDFVADLRAPTPSAAAEIAVPDGSALKAYLNQTKDALEKSAMARVTEAQRALLQRSRALELLSPEGRLQRLQQQLTAYGERMDRAAEHYLQRKTVELQGAMERLEALSPLAVLQRGYGAVLDGEGRVLSSVWEIKEGQRVELLLRDGRADARILSVTRTKDDPKGETE
jgi:exodeoxyribonuclease VII large subunit